MKVSIQEINRLYSYVRTEFRTAALLENYCYELPLNTSNWYPHYIYSSMLEIFHSNLGRNQKVELHNSWNDAEI